MTIEVDVLAAALEKLLAHVKETRGDVVDVAEDLYWFIPQDELWDPTKEPSSPTIGSLEDDWRHLVSLSRGEKEPFGYMLVWAASVLRAVGDRTL